ncbi:resolvase, partial [Microcystis aeruginosa NIES-298]
MREFLVQKINL